MNAVRCEQFGPPETLIVREVPPPPVGPGQVRLRVAACGLNFPDLLMIQNQYQVRPPLPFSPGGEVAGTVEAVGEGVTAFRPGDRVAALTGWGGLAEYAVAEVPKTLALPLSLDFATAASSLYTYGTSYHALRDRARLQPGETLLVLGAGGGVGLAAVQLGGRLGARVIAAASSDEKRRACRRAGAAETIDYTTEDLRERLRQFTDGRGVDVVYDPVGGAHTEPALRSMAWGGRYLVVGFASGVIPRLPLNLPLLKGCEIVGVFWGRFATEEPAHSARNFQELLTWLADGSLRQHIHATVPLREAPRALAALRDRQLVGKIVVNVESSTTQ
jgi:NADPH2:quinone reductase